MLFFQKHIIIITDPFENVGEQPVMKKCPQCNSVFGDDVHFCLNDGTQLVAENFSLPSDDDFEAATIIRHDPMVVNLAGENAAPELPIYQNPPVETIIVEKPVRSKNPLIFLGIGLLLGGALVLTALVSAKYFYQSDNGTNVKINPSGEPDANKPVKASPTAAPLNVNKASQKHELQTDRDDDEFNGRVIAVNAYVRSAPGRSSDETDVLPIDDRLNIERRENENSPWYFVTCEHGTSGWMHGNTIEFTK